MRLLFLGLLFSTTSHALTFKASSNFTYQPKQELDQFFKTKSYEGTLVINNNLVDYSETKGSFQADVYIVAPQSTPVKKENCENFIAPVLGTPENTPFKLINTELVMTEKGNVCVLSLRNEAPESLVKTAYILVGNYQNKLLALSFKYSKYMEKVSKDKIFTFWKSLK